MKNQRMKTGLKTHFPKLIALTVMLLVLTCCFGVLISAAGGDAPAFTVEEIKFSGLEKDEGGFWVKDFDNSIAAGTGATVVIKKADGSTQNVTATSATYNNKNVGADKITVAYKVDGTDYSIQVPGKINPKQLSWKKNGVASVTYNPLQSRYADVVVSGYELDLPAGVTLQAKVSPISFEAVDASSFVVYAYATLVDGAGVAVTNYTTTALPVNVTVNPVEIVSVVWNEASYRYTFGDEKLYEIGAYGLDADGNKCPLNVMIKDAAGEFITLRDAFDKGLYGQVKKGETTSRYTVQVTAPQGSLYTFAQSITDVTREVAVDKKYFNISIQGMTVLGEADLSDPTNIKPLVYQLAVQGDIPAELLVGFTYTYYDLDGNKVSENGVSAPGTYTVVVGLPVVEGDFDNYGYIGDGDPLSATLVIKRHYVAVGTQDDPYQIIVIGKDGIDDAIKAELSIPESLNAKTLYGFHVHKEYTFSLTGAKEGQTFQLVIPVSSAFVSNLNCEAVKLEDLYIYDMETETMVPATEKYNVTLSDDGAYFLISDYATEGDVTFVIAPVYHAPFFATAPGVALIVLLVLLALLVLFIAGLKLRRIERCGVNKTLVIETEAEVPEFEPIVVPDKIEDPEACLAESIDDLADALRENVEAPEATIDEDVDASDAVKDALDQLTAEAAAIVLEDTNALARAEAEAAAGAMADALVASLFDQVDAESNEKEADSDVVSAAVAEAMAENFNESADATDAIALIDEEDELTPEAFRDIVDSIVAEAMAQTMVLPENAFAEEETAEEVAEEAVEEVVEEATEEVAEEAVEEVVEETTEEVAEEAVEEVVEETTEEVVEEATEEVAEEAVEEVVEEATEEVAEEAVEEVVEETTEEVAEEVVEEAAEEEVLIVCAVVADSVAEAFELVSVDGVAPKAVEGTTMDSIAEAVNNAAEVHVPETWSDEMTDEVKVAVVEELAARLLGNNEPDEEPVEEPVEEVVEEAAPEVVETANEEDNDEDEGDEDEDDSSFAGFGSMPLDFIDAIAEAEKYSEMLAQEARGEVQLVTRYRRSFQSRLIQSQGAVQDYYNEIKNLLLSYKGVKNRISWNYESFNLGRTHVAKFNAKTRTLYIYMALDPSELVDSKYNVVDVSSKKKYATVPTLIKIKGDRKFKHAMELITKLCEEKLGLPKKKVVEEIDYRLPFKTTEELVNEGVIKKMVAAVPMEWIQKAQEAEEAKAAEAPVEEAPVEETVAVEAPVEESAETPSEEV